MRTRPLAARGRPDPDRVLRALRRLRRSPSLYWLVAGGLTVAAFASFQTRSVELDRRLIALGRTRRVAVVLADHAAGDALGAGDVELRSLPVSMLPTGALDAVPRTARLRSAVAGGEVLVEARLAHHTSALAARVPPGWRALAVPLPAGGLRLDAGDRVDLLAPGADGVSIAVVEDAVVIGRGDHSATIAVPRRAVAEVADAVVATTLTVSLVGPR
ncbi:MAG: hypothetical protein U0Q22_13800 [Acidimicrobiales bacterium]